MEIVLLETEEIYIYVYMRAMKTHRLLDLTCGMLPMLPVVKDFLLSEGDVMGQVCRYVRLCLVFETGV